MLICAIRGRTVFPQNPRNAQKLLAEKSLPQIARIYTDVGGYGILPYPRSQQHPKTSVSSVNSVGELTQPTICVDQCNPWENCIPTERTEPTEASCREGSPTDSTDLHRCRRVWHPAVPRQPLTQPTICANQCNLWENCISTEPTERTEASCREKSPTDTTRSCNYYKLTKLLLVSLCRLKYNVYICNR